MAGAKKNISAVDNVLAHYGVLGMRWGHHTNRSSSVGSNKPSRAEQKVAKKRAKLQSEFEKQWSNPKTARKFSGELSNHLDPVMQHELIRINAKPMYIKAAEQGKLDSLDNPIAKKYVKEYNDTFIRNANSYLSQFQSPDGTKRLTAVIDETQDLGFTVKITNKTLKHDDLSNSLTLSIKYIRDDNGMIIGFEIVPDILSQGEQFIKDFLAHNK